MLLSLQWPWWDKNMTLDIKYFEEMEAKIPKGKVRTPLQMYREELFS